MEDEAVARVKAEETQAMKDDAQRDLNQALPAVEKANEAISRLKKESIGEVRTFTKPPHMVEVVMQAVCIMFEKKKVTKIFSFAKLLNPSNFRIGHPQNFYSVSRI
jgi:dynein heavy chain